MCVEHLKRCKTSTLIDGIAFSYQVLCHYNAPVLSILPGVYPISFSIAGGVTVDFLVMPTKLWKSTGLGWGGILPFMYRAYIRGCYAASLVRGVGGVGYSRSCTVRTYVDATLLLRHWSGVGWAGWGGILTFMYLAYIRGCYAAATSLVRENLLVHTGCIDGMWKISKGAVSSSWSTGKDGAVNPQLLQGIRIWQCRWHRGNSTDFLSPTGCGRALSKRLEK